MKAVIKVRYPHCEVATTMFNVVGMKAAETGYPEVGSERAVEVTYDLNGETFIERRKMSPDTTFRLEQ